MCSMVRAFSYAIWLGDPDGRGRGGAPVRLAAARARCAVADALIALFLTPAVTAAVAMAAVAGDDRTCRRARRIRASPPAACSTRVTPQLAALPPGLGRHRHRLRAVRAGADAAFGDVGALSPRWSAPIIAAHEIFALPPAAARQVVAAAKPDYLAICGPPHPGRHRCAPSRRREPVGAARGRRRPALARARSRRPGTGLRGLSRQAVRPRPPRADGFELVSAADFDPIPALRPRPPPI